MKTEKTLEGTCMLNSLEIEERQRLVVGNMRMVSRQLDIQPAQRHEMVIAANSDNS